MGKYLTSLLSIVVQLFLITSIFAGDDVRKVQEELRKRHLFSGNPNGQITPALTAAVARYQKIKGFSRTGIIDFQTRASLGLVEPEPQTATTPIVFENWETVRGANGERIPPSPSWAWMVDEQAVEFERARNEESHAVAALAGTTVETTVPPVVPVKRHALNRPRRIRPQKESNPFMLALHSVDRAIKYLRGESDSKKKRIASRGL
jgi:peptidoglycan hydrolase-like protein with peptidoglycan-binding domain